MPTNIERLESRALLSAAVISPQAAAAPTAAELSSTGEIAIANVPWLTPRTAAAGSTSPTPTPTGTTPDTSGSDPQQLTNDVTPAALPLPPPTQTASVTDWTVNATTGGTSSLNLSWFTPTGVSAPAIRSYTISYIAGDYIPGPAGQTQTIQRAAPLTSISLAGLRSFTLYSINVTATDAAGGTQTAHVNAWTAAPATQQRYLYVFSLPKNKTGFTHLVPRIEVYDINNGHKWVKSIPLPAGIYNVRGVAANVATNRMYVAFYNSPNPAIGPGGLLCMNLKTNAVMWEKKYDPSVVLSTDRFALTQDGSKIYMPAGEDGPSNLWVVLDAATGNRIGTVPFVTSPHNTVASLDGKYVFLEGQEQGVQPASLHHMVGVVDTATDKVVRMIGPFMNTVRPYTINGKASLLFGTVDGYVGFQVADVNTGKILYTVAPPNYHQPVNPAPHNAFSHGISMTPDEKEIWVVDGLKNGVHIFDVTGLPSSPPKYLGFVATRKQGKNLAGQTDAAAINDPQGEPSWVDMSYDGKYVYTESGEVIDRYTRKVLTVLRPMIKNSKGVLVQDVYTHSRYQIEVDVDGGAPIRVTQQFGVGRVR